MKELFTFSDTLDKLILSSQVIFSPYSPVNTLAELVILTHGFKFWQSD